MSLATLSSVTDAGSVLVSLFLVVLRVRGSLAKSPARAHARTVHLEPSAFTVSKKSAEGTMTCRSITKANEYTHHVTIWVNISGQFQKTKKSNTCVTTANEHQQHESPPKIV